MLRILAISDIHANFKDLEDIVDYVNALNLKFNMIIIAGDLTNARVLPKSTNTKILKRIVELLDTIAPIYAVLGNDDYPDLDLEKYGIHSLEQQAITMDKWTFVGWGGAPDAVHIPTPPDLIKSPPQKRQLDGVNLWKDETVIPNLAPILDRVPQVQHLCVVSHYHPDAVFPSRGRYPLLGSKGLKAVLMRYHPKLWICGHIHPQVGFKKWFKPSQTLLIRVTCVKSDVDKFSHKPFGKVFWILTLEETGSIQASYTMLADSPPQTDLFKENPENKID
ncbi:MAG: metallophosphoesterase family protein [Candidatus Helarchaeota archaeon]